MHIWEAMTEKCSLTKLLIDCSRRYKAKVYTKGVLSLSLQVTDRPTLTTQFLYSLHLNNSVDILFSTFLLTDPEVFLMPLHNSVWCCIATVQVSLYVTVRGEQVAPTGGADISGSSVAEWSDWFWWRWLEGWTNVDTRMIDWWIAGWMIND